MSDLERLSKSSSGLIAQLSAQVNKYVQDEIRLAKREIFAMQKQVVNEAKANAKAVQNAVKRVQRQVGKFL